MSEAIPEPGEITGRDGVMLVRIGNHTYPAKQVTRCKTCQSKYRTQIEKGIIGGMTYASIISDLIEPFDDHSPLGAPTYQNVLTHVRRGHMPIPYATQRRIIEGRAREVGKSIEHGEQLIIDSVSVGRTIVQRGFELLNNGEIQPSMGDLMKALQLQQVVEGGKDGELDEETWREALITYMEIVQRNVAPDIFQRIGREMAASPVLQEISLRRRQTVPGEIQQED